MVSFLLVRARDLAADQSGGGRTAHDVAVDGRGGGWDWFGLAGVWAASDPCGGANGRFGGGPTALVRSVASEIFRGRALRTFIGPAECLVWEAGAPAG